MIVDAPSTPFMESAAGVPALTGKPALREFRAMNVDYHSTSRSISQAFDNAKIPRNFASGYFAGATELGKSLQGVGDFLAGLSVEIGKANSQKQIDAAEISMEKTHGDFAAWMAENPDPTTWGPEWEKRVKGLHESTLTQDNLSPYAKDVITRNMGKFAVKTGTGVQVAAAKQIFADARDTGIALAETKAMNGDFDGANAQFDALGASHRLSATEVVAHKGRVLAKRGAAYENQFKLALQNSTPDNPEYYDLARRLVDEGSQQTPGGIAPVLDDTAAQLARKMVDTKQKTDTLFQRAMVDPLGTQEYLNKTEGGKFVNEPDLPPQTRINLSGTARHQEFLFQQAEGDKIRDAMDANTLGSADDVKKLFKYSDPDQKAALLKRFDSLHSTSTGENFNALYAEALSLPYELGENNRELAGAVGAFREKVRNTLTTERGGPILDMVAERTKGGRKDTDPALKMGVDTFQHLHENGMLGFNWKESAKQSGHLQEAFKDVGKLQAMGFADATIELISGKTIKGKPTGKPALEGPAAVAAFKEGYAMALAKAKDNGKASPISPELYSKLTPYAQGLFQAALSGSFSDEDLRQQSAVRATQLRVSLEQWVKAQKVTPTPEQVQKQVKALLDPLILGTTTSIASPAPTAPPSNAPATPQEIDALKAKYKK